jgi:oxygen-independent coproporphyrinogen III oxidase
MAGIYIHIPFCQSKCAYCDFYKTTELSLKPLLIDALIKELHYRKDFLQGESIKTIYFGGGTPSVLTQAEIEIILEEIGKIFMINSDAEITFEANPDDLTLDYLYNLAKTPVNRLSIGVQSFLEGNLLLMKRRHNSLQAVKCVENAFNSGFENISIDLIYGFPGLSNEDWEENLKKALILPISHLSAYHLTYHKGTNFYKLLKKGFLHEIPEEDSVRQFDLLIETAALNNFEQYEISNFAKDGKISKHNYGYWFGDKYLGIGPSAHSYSKVTRHWNISDVIKYIQGVNSGEGFSEMEALTETDNYNDFIITRLRTKWGISKKFVKTRFGDLVLKELKQNIQPFLISGNVLESGGIYTLTRKGFFISDKIMEALIKIEI